MLVRSQNFRLLAVVVLGAMVLADPGTFHQMLFGFLGC